MKILLVCSAGMSTSLLVKKMQTNADERNLSVQIEAVAESEVGDAMVGTDVLLIGPQIRYLERKIKELVRHTNIKVAVIDSMAYGLMRGDQIIDQAMNIYNNKQKGLVR